MARLTSLLFVLWVGVTVGTVVDLQKRILGGQDCLNNERQYHVQLRKSSPSDKFVCGGSLISAQWILTAAHCWDKTLYAVVGVQPDQGLKTLIEVRPHFFLDNQYQKHDIMLLKITDPNPTRIQPVSLPDCKSCPRKVQIAGHAHTTVDQKNQRDDGHHFYVDYTAVLLSAPKDPLSALKKTKTGLLVSKVTVQSNTLLCANTDVVNCQPLRDCIQKKYRQLWATRSCEHWLCFKRAGVEVSGGDSGGGVVYNGMIYGVHVLSEKRTCNLPAASMDVCRYINWIVRTTGIARPRKVRLGCALL